MFKAKPRPENRKGPSCQGRQRCSVKNYGARGAWDDSGSPVRRNGGPTAIVGFISCSTAPNCTDCGDVKRVTPLTLYRNGFAAARQW